MRSLRLAKDLRSAIAAGHPWIYARAVAGKLDELAPGEVVRVVGSGGFAALGFADPESAIGVRVLTRAEDERIDGAWVEQRIRRACRLRRLEPSLAGTNALRLVHGESDGLPGLVLDLYDQVGVVRFDGAGAAAMWRPHIDRIRECVADQGWPVRSVWQRELPGGRSAQLGRLLFGEEPPESVAIAEHGARFEVDVRRGHKTGLFLDQRENRVRVGQMASGLDVLNLFSYTGGFSVHAGLGGARRVTSVDCSGPVIEAARRNLVANGLDLSAHELVAKDAFAFLSDAVERGRRWDLVICDPPSFAPNKRARAKALRAYRSLNRLALTAVSHEGMLVTASCSSHVRGEDLVEVTADAAAAVDRSVRITATTGAGVDHPRLPGFPEGDYLCCLWLRAD